MMTWRKTALASTICLLALAACSNGKFTYGKALGDVSKLTGFTTGYEEIDPAFSEGTVTKAPEGPPLIVGFEAIRVAIPLAEKSGVSKTYASPDGVVIAMNSGFVTRATGLGIDMNGSYLRADSPWFNGLDKAATEGLSADRVIEYWENSRLKRDKYRCGLKVTPREGGGSLIDETCKRYFDPEGFVNRYWIKADSTIECSRQWIHPKLSPLQFFSTEQQALTLDLTKNGC